MTDKVDKLVKPFVPDNTANKWGLKEVFLIGWRKGTSFQIIKCPPDILDNKDIQLDVGWLCS